MYSGLDIFIPLPELLSCSVCQLVIRQNGQVGNEF